MLMNKPVKMRPIGAVPVPPTQEEKEAQAMRAFLQKRNSIAEGILYNAISSGGPTRTIIDKDGQPRPDYRPVVQAAIEAADEYMRLAMGIEAKVKEEAK